MTKTIKFKCTLESDLVLSQTSSSEGNQKTLDFIPGNNFLGIVAARYIKMVLQNPWKYSILAKYVLAMLTPPLMAFAA